MKLSVIVALLFFCTATHGQTVIKAPLPTNAQLAWHEMEFYLFVHFGPNTFTDKEWGHGDEPEDLFNPTELDCNQWARVAKAAGAKGIIITAKHHDGFCLWPSKYSTHTVRESKWKNGKGDVLKELSQACKKAGLRFGVYISPWDRNHPDYGTDKYNDVFVNMMKEIFTNYGPIWELWWDGANGEGPNGKKQVYDWNRFEKTVRQLSPNTVVFSDIGPDIRWVGNESGIAGKTNWNYLDTAGFKRGLGAPPTDTLNQGNRHGKHWIPAECDVSIRPGWFYHSNEDDKVKTSQQLFDLYLKSVGRGANLLLNVPPDRRGLIHQNDEAALTGFKKLKAQSFKNNLLKQDTISSAIRKTKLGVESVTTMFIESKQASRINCIVLQELILQGQIVQQFSIELYNNQKLVQVVRGTTIGRNRILTFPAETVTSFKVVVDASASQNISGVKAYLIDESLIEH
jgi:alpha-L-fucosidase